MAKMYSRGLQLALGGGGQSPLRFAVTELRRMMEEMRRGDHMPTLARMQWEKAMLAAKDKRVELVMEQAERAHEQCMTWANELTIVARVLVDSAASGGFWDKGPVGDDVVEQDTEVRCSAYDGHDWRYVRTSHDGMMSMYKCKICGEEVVM